MNDEHLFEGKKRLWSVYGRGNIFLTRKKKISATALHLCLQATLCSVLTLSYSKAFAQVRD